MRYGLLLLCLAWTVPAVKADELPFEALFPCAVTPPPIIEHYVNASMKKREALLTKYTEQLLIDLKDCDDKVTIFREWYAKSLNIQKGTTQ